MSKKRQVISKSHKVLLSTGVLTAALSLFPDKAEAVTAAVGVNAQIYQGLSVPTLTNMDFGILTNGTGAGGSATLTPGGGLSGTTGTVTGVGGTPTAGRVVVVGEMGATVQASVPATVTLANTTTGAVTMKVGSFDCDTGAGTTRICMQTMPAGSAAFDYGATLTVGAAQASGMYLGSVTVTLTYQ